MKNIDTEIYSHDDNVDVMHKINTLELHNWINHLTYIKRESSSLIGLCDEEQKNNDSKNQILERFQEKEKENEALLASLNKYNVSREQIIECEDTQCDMAYISEHESYRREYLQHLKNYRDLKDEFFSKIQGKFSFTDNEEA